VSKFIAGLIVTVATVVAVFISYGFTVSILFRLRGAESLLYLPGLGQGVLLMTVMLILFGYAVSLLVSTLVDRIATAVVLSLICGIGAGGGLMALVSDAIPSAGRLTDVPLAVAYAFAAAAFLSASYVAFCKGETLRTSRHIGIAATILGMWCLVGWAGLLVQGCELEPIAVEIVVNKAPISKPQLNGDFLFQSIRTIPTGPAIDAASKRMRI
jgi:hypothetical protein